MNTLLRSVTRGILFFFLTVVSVENIQSSTTIDGDGKAALLGAAGDVAAGVLQNAPTAGQTAIVAVSGVTNILIGATLDEGELVMGDSASEGIPATTGEFFNGTCLTGGADGATGVMVLHPTGYVP